MGFKKALTPCLLKACNDTSWKLLDFMLRDSQKAKGEPQTINRPLLHSGRLNTEYPGFLLTGCCTFSSTCCTQSGAIQAHKQQFHLAKHWCHVVPLSWMALISALSWGRLISTVLTLSPVQHCDTGHRRNSSHPHFSMLKHHV